MVGRITAPIMHLIHTPPAVFSAANERMEGKYSIAGLNLGSNAC